jgi:hypothetical protein
MTEASPLEVLHAYTELAVEDELTAPETPSLPYGPSADEPTSEVLPMRFWAKVLVGDGCWEWIGAKAHGGYGSIWWKGRTCSSHRVAYECLVGPIPEGLTLDHLCRNRACARPDHLEAVSSRVNTLRGDGRSAAQHRQTRCSRGHELDTANTRIDSNGARHCRPCSNLTKSAWRRLRTKAAANG